MRITSRTSNEQGIALVTALLAVLLATALMAGMFASLTADQRSHAVDRDQSQAYAAAHAGLEKLTSNLAQLFVTDFSPSAGQIDGIDNVPPSIPGFEYESPDGSSGYAVSFNPDANGNPASNPNADVTTGPFTGFKGLITPYTITVTARSENGGSEVRLRREIQTVAVPVFQFGIFGERSLSFHAGADFDFGGRVHSNTHLFLAEGTGATLTFRDKLTAVNQVVRSELENGYSISSSGHTGTVRIPTVIGSSYRNLASTEGSVSGGPASAAVAGWKNLSEVTYNTNVRNTMTGAKRLDLPLVSQGAVPIDLIRRPLLGSAENVANAPVFLQRYFAQASLRILLSDRAADIVGLPSVTATLPVPLSGNWIGGGAPIAGYVVNAAAGRTPLARAVGNSSTTISGGASTYAAPYHQLNVAAVPAAMLMSPLTVNAVPGVLTCLGKTANTFTGCTVVGATIPAGATIGATTLAGNTVSVVTTAASAPAGAGANRTVTVTANGTMPFAQDFAWIHDRTNNTPTPMSCEGYNTNVAPQRLINCRILNVTNAQTTAGRVISTYSAAGANTDLLGGFIKIEKQTSLGAWTDVTAEILSLGFAAPNQEGTGCADPTPNAVIRIQRLRDNGGSCFYAASNDSRDYWPNVLYDAREGVARDVATTAAMTMGGVMHYISLDVANLKRWLSGAIGVTGTQAWNNNGYIVYFSDRRGNHDDASAGQAETGEYGYEDSINPGAGGASSAPNAVLEVGEDRNENGVLQNYGWTPSAVAIYGGLAPFNAGATALTNITNHPEARVNRPVLFRRALKLINGGINGGVNNLPDAGLTVATENGVYVQGNYNAIAGDVTAEPNRPAAIIADALTILSNNWNDTNSLRFGNDMTSRNATTTGYRFATISGKSIAFPRPGWAPAGDTGTDGGVHNFMRMLEDWSGQTINYRGSIVSLYTARQFTGIYRANANVYAPGTRAFNFDTDFLTPALLPPGTPMFRDINTLKFRQILRPNQ
jgi:hypothetical protein